jgi:hypothetical protein
VIELGKSVTSSAGSVEISSIASSGKSDLVLKSWGC